MTGIERHWKEQDELLQEQENKRIAALVARADALRLQLAAVEAQIYPHRQNWNAQAQANMGMQGVYGLASLFGGAFGGDAS